jgi:hypothetical protein
MTISRRALLLASLALPLLPAIAEAAANGPADIIRAVYAFSAGKDGKWKGPSALVDDTARRTWFSARINAAYQEEKSLLDPSGDDMGALTFNPISDGVEGRIDRVKIKTVRQDDAKARVTVRFRHPGAAEQARSLVTYDLIREDAAWKIADITIEFEGGGCDAPSTFQLQAKLDESIAERRKDQAEKKSDTPAEKDSQS